MGPPGCPAACTMYCSVAIRHEARQPLRLGEGRYWSPPGSTPTGSRRRGSRPTTSPWSWSSWRGRTPTPPRCWTRTATGGTTPSCSGRRRPRLGVAAGGGRDPQSRGTRNGAPPPPGAGSRPPSNQYSDREHMRSMLVNWPVGVHLKFKHDEGHQAEREEHAARNIRGWSGSFLRGKRLHDHVAEELRGELKRSEAEGTEVREKSR